MFHVLQYNDHIQRKWKFVDGTRNYSIPRANFNTPFWIDKSPTHLQSKNNRFWAKKRVKKNPITFKLFMRKSLMQIYMSPLWRKSLQNFVFPGFIISIYAESLFPDDKLPTLNKFSSMPSTRKQQCNASKTAQVIPQSLFLPQTSKRLQAIVAEAEAGGEVEWIKIETRTLIQVIIQILTTRKISKTSRIICQQMDPI